MALLQSQSTISRSAPATILVLSFLATTVALDHRVIVRDQYDDSYITYRYAVNLATGKGLVFNSYERINSASSFLYTLALAGAYAVGFRDLERFAGLFGLAMGSLLIVVTFLMALRVTERRALAFAFVLPLCIAGSIGGWAVSGMDTILFAALVATFLHLYLFAAASKRAAFAVLGLIVLCRLEGLLLLVLAAGREAAAARADRRWRDLAWFVALAVVPAVGLAAFDHAYYGTVLPHSFYVKRVSQHYSPDFAVHVATVVGFLVAFYLGYLVLAAVAMYGAARSLVLQRRQRRDTDPLSFLCAYAFISLAAVLFGPGSESQRYIVHLLPVIAVLALAGWEAVSLRLAAPAARRAALAAVVIVLGVGALRDALATATQLTTGAAQQSARKEIGHWLNSHTQPTDLIASADLGAIAYVARERDFVDVFGLTSGGFAELSQTRPDQLPVLFARRRPAYIADTVRVVQAGAGGMLTATDLIVARPAVAFRNVPAGPSVAPQTAYRRRPLFRREGGGWTFMVVALDWDQPGR